MALKRLIADAKTRSLIIFLGLIIIAGVTLIVIGSGNKKSKSNTPSSKTVYVPNIQSIPGKGPAPSQEYEAIQNQQNQQQAREALATGGSAIPTILNQGERFGAGQLNGDGLFGADGRRLGPGGLNGSNSNDGNDPFGQNGLGANDQDGTNRNAANSEFGADGLNSEGDNAKVAICVHKCRTLKENTRHGEMAVAACVQHCRRSGGVYDPTVARTFFEDQQNNSLGSTSSSDEFDAAAAEQAERLRQQRQAALNAAVENQAKTLLASWNVPEQEFQMGDLAGEEDDDDSANDGTSDNNQGQGGASTVTLFPAGTILFGVLDTAINTDEPGPVMASIVTGKYKGSKLIGNLGKLNSKRAQKVLLSFNLMTVPSNDKSLQVKAVAIDPDTARTAFASSTDNHYLLRYGTLFASSFMAGFGKAVSQSGSTDVSGDGTTTTTHNELSPKDKSIVALGEVGTEWGKAVGDLYDTPPTIKVDAGIGIGILFTDDVRENR